MRTMTAAECHSKGRALFENGDVQEARNLFALALETEPQNMQYMLDYAQVYVELGQHAKAEAFYLAALEIEPNSPLGNYRLGNLRKQYGQVIAAVEKYSLAIAATPDYFEAFNNRGGAYHIMGKFREATADYLRAIELNPVLEEAYLNLGRLLDTEGDFDAAAKMYKRALENGLNRELFTHLLESVSGGTSEKAPLGYVRAIFDGYAGAFDNYLVQQLGYTLPSLIGTQVRAIAAQRKDSLVALDLGCGTGLCGAEIAACVGHLVGVDVSAGMLDQADRRGVYHDLVDADIERYLSDLEDASIDVLIAADVFTFFGSLENLFAHAARVLRPDGAFIFSIELLNELTDYRLQHTGRFQHAVEYIERLAASSDMVSSCSEVVDLRIEQGCPVRGQLFAYNKRIGRGRVHDQ